MSTWKLQKLLYYSQAWQLVWEDKPLFAEPIEAWANGPVVRDVYNKHRRSFSISEDDWPYGDRSNLTEPEKESVDAVLKAYGTLDGRRLSLLTHSERPWQDARKGLAPTDRSSNVISIDSMQEFYDGLYNDQSAQEVGSMDWPDE